MQIAEQAARLRQQPDVLQLSEILLTIRQLPLLGDANWLADCLADLSVDVTRISVTSVAHQALVRGFYGESARAPRPCYGICALTRQNP